MSIIKSGQAWQFRTELELEEIIWRNLPELLNLQPIKRQFSVAGQYCDLLAVGSSNQLTIIELKNAEDRYIVQQLTRYYDALINLKRSLPGVDTNIPVQLLAIAPSFHADTLTDLKYSTLAVELLTFQIEPVYGNLNLVLFDAAGCQLSALQLQNGIAISQPAIEINDPPRKLLNWLSHSPESEFDWVMKMRSQLLRFDPRMKEIVDGQRILYGKGKSKPCCELKKRKNDICSPKGPRLEYFLWLPDPENKPHVIKMQVEMGISTKNVAWMAYGKRGYRSGSPWQFPKCVKWMKSFGYQRSLELYKPHLNKDMTISPLNIVNLALHTWCNRL